MDNLFVSREVRAPGAMDSAGTETEYSLSSAPFAHEHRNHSMSAGTRSRLSMPNLLKGRPECSRFGIPQDWAYGILVEAGWNDVDKLGHVNNAAFWRWCDDARVQYAIDTGLSVPAPETPSYVVVKAEADFLAPMAYREQGVMTCRTVRVGRSSLDTEHALWLMSGQAFFAKFTIVLASQIQRKSIPLPNHIRARILDIDAGAMVDR